jgi:hypothetical protein
VAGREDTKVGGPIRHRLKFSLQGGRREEMNRKMKKGRKMEERNEKKCKELMKRNEEVRHESSMFHAFAVSHFVCFTFPFFLVAVEKCKNTTWFRFCG